MQQLSNSSGKHPNYDPKQRDFLTQRGVVFLEDGWDWALLDCHYLALESNGFGTQINAMVVDKFCEKYGLDFIDTLQIIKQI